MASEINLFMDDLTLNKRITPDKLIKAGFKCVDGNNKIFVLKEWVYKRIIYFRIRIDLNEDADENFESFVIDCNTNNYYIPFYNHINTNDDVRDEVEKAVEEIIRELKSKRIFYRKKENKDIQESCIS